MTQCSGEYEAGLKTQQGGSRVCAESGVGGDREGGNTPRRGAGVCSEGRTCRKTLTTSAVSERCLVEMHGGLCGEDKLDVTCTHVRLTLASECAPVYRIL